MQMNGDSYCRIFWLLARFIFLIEFFFFPVWYSEYSTAHLTEHSPILNTAHSLSQVAVTARFPPKESTKEGQDLPCAVYLIYGLNLFKSQFLFLASDILRGKVRDAQVSKNVHTQVA